MRLVIRRVVIVVAVATIATAACGSGAGSKKAENAAQRTPAAALTADSGGAGAGGGVAGGEATSASSGPSGAAADSAFQPATHGFAFANYVNEKGITNLTPEDMRAVYGDAVCSNTVGGQCHLTPPAQAQMEQFNDAMGGGHCYGFSVASLLFHKGTLKPDAFGATAVPALKLNGNTALQRQIARAFIAQTFDSVHEKAIRGRPNDVLDALVKHFNTGPGHPETYTIGFFKPDWTGGHAVTPYAVVDRGAGKVAVMVYDNNYPKVEREILFDRAANTWSYEASINPKEANDLYQGDARTQTLELYPTSPGLGIQPCSFCADQASARDAGTGAPSSNLGAPSANLGTIALSGAAGRDHPHLLLTDPKGRRVGYVNGKFVAETPEVQVIRPLLTEPWKLAPEPIYKIALGTKFTVTIDGAGLTKPVRTKVSFVGRGRNVSVGNIDIKKGQQDVLTLPAGASQLSYKTGGAGSPVFEIGADNPGADYAFTVKAKELKPNAVLGFDLNADRLAIDTTAAGAPVSLDLGMLRLDGNGLLSFNHDAVQLDAAEASVAYGGWAKEGDPITLDVTEDGQTQHESLEDGDEDESFEANPEPDYCDLEDEGSSDGPSATTGEADDPVVADDEPDDPVVADDEPDDPVVADDASDDPVTVDDTSGSGSEEPPAGKEEDEDPLNP